MTWKELKEAIEKMPQGELEKEVNVWGEEFALTAASIDVAHENMYFGTDFDYCEPESNIDPETLSDKDTHLICEKGFHYLWAE